MHRVHVNRLKANPQSLVYRAARKTSHILGRGRATHDTHTPREGRDHDRADDGDTDGETSSTPWEVPGSFTGRAGGNSFLRAGRPVGAESSGVTTVLEAVETEQHFSDGSEGRESQPTAEEQSSGTEDTSDGDPVSAANEPQAAVRPQKPQRQRRPPPYGIVPKLLE